MLNQINPVSLNEKYLVFDKIFKDGYCQRSFVKHGMSPHESEPIYYINYNGLLLFQNGGYRKLNQNKKITHFLKLTEVFAVIVGGIFAATYYLLETLKFISGIIN